MSTSALSIEKSSEGVPAYTPRLGHVHLKVRDLSRAAAFYKRLFHLKTIEHVGDHYLFLSGDDQHHEIALQSVGPEAPVPLSGSTGLYHVAFEVGNKREFATFFQALQEEDIAAIARDHAISWALYFDDPDGNGLELYVDTRHDHGEGTQWGGTSLPLTAEQILAHLV